MRLMSTEVGSLRSRAHSLDSHLNGKIDLVLSLTGSGEPYFFSLPFAVSLSLVVHLLLSPLLPFAQHATTAFFNRKIQNGNSFEVLQTVGIPNAHIYSTHTQTHQAYMQLHYRRDGSGLALPDAHTHTHTFSYISVTESGMNEKAKK